MRRGTAVRGTAGWGAAMYEAKGQAELYVRKLPASEHNPPFIIVADVGHSIELFSDFSRQGRTYIPFPDPRTHRLKLHDLAEAEIRERLKQVWTEPLALDPSRRTAKVTREVAAKLAELARSLEHSSYAPDLVAHFLMRCLFTFFAEDVGLLPKDCFTAMLSRLREEGRITAFSDMAGSLWATMKTGGFSPILMQSVLRFNGGLFDQATALPLTDEQIGLLIDSGRKQWREDEPAIFGTLLERVLDKNERHKLGAHFTPRAYVERLVLPTIVEPLREQWGSGRGHPTPLTNLAGSCLELFSGKGLESALLEGIGLKHETVFCHHGAVLPEAPMDTRTVPWLHSVRLPPRGHLPNRHNGEPSVLSRSLARCVSFSPLKSGNKSNRPQASTVAGKEFAGHCNPSS